MFQNEPDNPRARPRANTTTAFTAALTGWRSGSTSSKTQLSKPDTTPPATNTPPPMQLDDLIESLSSPAVMSVAHARALAITLGTHSPVPRPSTLTPILEKLCTPESPVSYQCAGFDIITAYFENPDIPLLGMGDRLAYIALFEASMDIWTLDVWESRFRALAAFIATCEHTLGVELKVLYILKGWITAAFDSILHNVAMERKEREERERCAEMVSRFLSDLVCKGPQEFVARIPEQEFIGVLGFYRDLVKKVIDTSSLRRPSLASPPPPAPASDGSPSRPFHRRNASSVSISSSIISPPIPSVPPKSAADIAITMYLEHHRRHPKNPSTSYLNLILPSLLRALAHCASHTLPRLSISNSGPSHSPTSEDKLNVALSDLLTGSHGTTCMLILKRHLSPPDDSSDSTTMRSTAEIAFGAQRTLRLHIRTALMARMTRDYINQPTYSHSGVPANLSLDADVLERAWPRNQHGSFQGQSGWEAGKHATSLTTSARDWVAFCTKDVTLDMRSTAENILDEIAGTLKDVLQELDNRLGDDSVALTRDEAMAVGKTLFRLAEYLIPLKNADDSPYILPLTKFGDAPTPFLRSLTFILSRDHSVQLEPLLSRILLHVADHLEDAATAKLPMIMKEQNDLTPMSPDWIENWSTLLKTPTLLSARRPLTKRAIMSVLHDVHASIVDMPRYRKPLVQLVMDSCQRSIEDESLNRLDGEDRQVMWTILADEAVYKLAEGDGQEAVTALLELFEAGASGEDYDYDTFDVASSSTLGTHPAGPTSALITPSTTASPILSRTQSHVPAAKEKEQPTGLINFISSLASGPSSRSQSIPPVTVDIPEDSIVPEPLPEITRTVTTEVAAACALVLVFSQIAFTPHALHEENLLVAIRVFRTMIALLSDGKSVKARLTILQFMSRLRADRDHQLYYVSNNDGHGLAAMLGSLIQRSSARGATPDSAAAEQSRARPRVPRAATRGRTVGSGSGTSRSRSRAGPQPATPTLKPRDPLWSLPETQLPFTVVDQDKPSERLSLYDPQAPEKIVLPISIYLVAIHEILEREESWEILAYVLCHLPNQLGNKHLFCGPKSRAACSKLLNLLCSGVLTESLAAQIPVWPSGLKARDAQSLAYHTLSVLIGYQPCFDPHQQHLLVSVFQNGLDGQPVTIQCCLHALSLAAFELPTSMAKFMSPILEKLSQIMSNANMAVHILAFLVIISSQPRLYANFIENDFRLVFGVALQYLQHQNRNRDDQSVSWTLSEYVRILSYYNVYVWFLAIKLPDRPKHITYILRQLELANEDNPGPDDSTIVCCDWLERYTYASADPRPAASVLSEIVMNPSEPPEEAIQEKTWAMGNSIVTVRTLKRRGWFEVLSRRPSGFTKMLCRLENSPLVGPGDVDPDLVSVPAALVMEREGQLPPGEPGVQGDDLTPKPDSITGYVWSGTAPSQRRKAVEIDPSFFILQMSDGSKSDRHLLNDDKKLRSLCSALDRLPVIDTHKVGILYVAPGQTNELEILANTHGSPAYTRFLEGIGRLIDLRGQVDVYVGGLEPGLDGDYAYAWWDDIGQILYHTATMMPTNQDDPQLINKKRNIGNDYVRIVWNDSGIPYRFDTLSTQFQFVNIVIEPHSLGPIAAFSDNLHEIEYFKVTVQRAEKMADFAPVGSFKLISSKSLPLLIRQLSLLADWFASVYAHTESDTVRTEVVTNWQSRLQTIRRYHDQNLPGREVGDEPFRDFTAQF